MTTPIALQLYTIRDLLAQDFEGTVRKVSDMGYGCGNREYVWRLARFGCQII